METSKTFSLDLGHVSQDGPPEGDEWTKKRLLTAQKAITACAVCRSAVGLALEDMADQIDKGSLQIGTPQMQARGVILPKIPAGQILQIMKLLGYNGAGRQIPLYVGPDTISLSELELGRTVTQLSSDTSSETLRNLARKVREKTSECCRKQVWKRVLPNDSKRKWVKVTHKRTRLA
jgi:hypothetical protein